MNKRMSCQPEMLRTIDFNQFCSNEHSVHREISEESFSGDESNVVSGSGAVAHGEASKMESGRLINDISASDQTIPLEGFYQMLRVCGRIRLLAISDIKLSNFQSEPTLLRLTFRLKCNCL